MCVLLHSIIKLLLQNSVPRLVDAFLPCVLSTTYDAQSNKHDVLDVFGFLQLYYNRNYHSLRHGKEVDFSKCQVVCLP